MVVIRQEKQKEDESSGVGRLLLLTAAVIIYLFIGMGIFYKIEHPIEREAHRKRIPLRKMIESFQESHPSVNETELQKLLVNVLRMNGDGKLQWTGADPPHWTYPRAIYFAVSVITTIGFGNVILKTNMGRVCAVLYAVVGIPLTVLLYVEIGRFLSEQMCELVLRLYTLCHPQHEELSGKNATIISTVFIFTIGTISFIFLPSLVIQILEEGWTYLEACYFAFTTIATIGFGDYVAGADEVMPSKFMHWYRAALTLWIFLGLGWLSTLLNVIGRLARYLMDKGEEMINHEYDQLVDKDHFEHCHHCRHKRHSKRKHHGKKRRRSKPSTPELEENNHD